MLVGQTRFAILRDLASLCEIADISLDDIMVFLQTHYQPQTMEIADDSSLSTPGN